VKKIAIAFLLFVASGAAAQPMPGKWWRRDDVAQKLELNREQQRRLDAVFQAAADELIDAKGDVQKLEIALRGELDRPQLRRNEIQRIATQLSAARARLFERELMMLVDMRSVLEADQWERLQDLDLPRLGRPPAPPHQRRR
jgi:Spy/CpxP family protein refolding chaperone